MRASMASIAIRSNRGFHQSDDREGFEGGMRGGLVQALANSPSTKIGMVIIASIVLMGSGPFYLRMTNAYFAPTIESFCASSKSAFVSSFRLWLGPVRLQCVAAVAQSFFFKSLISVSYCLKPAVPRL